MLGPDRRQVKQRQLQALGFRLAYSQEECLRNILLERLVRWLQVSGENDDVRRFLRDGGFTIQIELRNSLYFPRTLVRNGMG